MKTMIGLLTTLACATTVHAQQLELEPYTVRDAMAVHKDALTFLKPKGWTVKGGVQWYLNLSHQACVELKIANPNGLEQIETFPWCRFAHFTNPVIPMQPGHNYMGDIILAPIDDPREAVRQLTIPNLRAQYKPRIVGYTDMPDVAKTLSAMHGGATVKAGKVRLEYAIGGTMVEEDIYLSIYSLSANLGGNNISTLWGPAWPPFSLRAEKGKLDAQTPTMLAVVNSAVANPRWFGEVVYVQGLFQERMKQGIIDAVNLSDTIRRNSDAIFRMTSDAYWARQASQDRIHRNFSNYIRGVTPYHSPHGKGYTIQLPSHYQYAWGSSTGGYILSNNPNFDPNLHSNHSWQLLKQAR